MRLSHQGIDRDQLQLTRHVDDLPLTGGYMAERADALYRLDGVPSAMRIPGE